MKWLLLILSVVAALTAIVALLGALLPREHVATRAAVFRAAPAVLFTLLRDFAAQPTWRRDLRAVELLPSRDGAPCHREISRHGAITYLVREERTGERLVIEIADDTLPFGGRWTFALNPVPAGTELRITEHGFVKNVLFRFLARFVFGHASTMENYLRDLAQKLGEPAPHFPR